MLSWGDFIAALCGFLESDGNVSFSIRHRETRKGKPFSQQDIEWSVSITQNDNRL